MKIIKMLIRLFVGKRKYPNMAQWEQIIWMIIDFLIRTMLGLGVAVAFVSFLIIIMVIVYAAIYLLYLR